MCAITCTAFCTFHYCLHRELLSKIARGPMTSMHSESHLGMMTDTAAYNARLRALGRGDWRRAYTLFQTMEEKHVPRDAETYDLMVQALEEGGHQVSPLHVTCCGGIFLIWVFETCQPLHPLASAVANVLGQGCACASEAVPAIRNLRSQPLQLWLPARQLTISYQLSK